MDDVISRQAAIDAHYEYCNKHPDAGFPVWSLNCHPHSLRSYGARIARISEDG